MCDQHVIRQVVENVYSRRGILGIGASVAALGLMGQVKADAPKTPSLLDVPPQDLTHALTPDFPTYFGEPDFSISPRMKFVEHSLNINEWHLGEHVGTHMDAPLHFTGDGLDLASVPPQNLVARLAVVDIRGKAAHSPDAQVVPEDIKQWVAKNGPLPERTCVAMQSNWSEYVGHDKFRGKRDDGLHFPGFHPEAISLLLELGNVIGIAVDTLSLDYGQATKFESHALWLPSGRWGIECLKLGRNIPQNGAVIVVGAPKVSGASGGPVRVLAFVPTT